ncbi:tyrosine-type recombinase/integrase [Streptomyces sp. NPDC002853]
MPESVEPVSYLRLRPEEWECWLDDLGIPDGTPYLLSPGFVYDVHVNAYFHRVDFLGGPLNSQLNRASALERFFNFLHLNRGSKIWRDATEADHLAYHHWRRRDPRGPRVDGGTWSQEVSHLQQFYVFALSKGWVSAVPIPQRARNEWSGIQAPRRRRSGSETVPATYAHDEGSERIEWLPQTSYRRWRDVGIRGYGLDGRPRAGFRGRWVERNTVFSDLMVRTGQRLSEQAHLVEWEVPTGPGPAGYSRFWLPAAIAKWQSAGWIYVPASLRRDLTDYALHDRAAVVEEAQAEGRYGRIRRPLIVEDRDRANVARYTTGAMAGRRVDVRLLGPHERRRLLVETDAGLEPAMFWLGESGMPLAVSTWKDMFTTANQRCTELGLAVAAHAHLLRHTFAVVTLEQLQRGHIAALGELNPDQRLHYVRIFGDPLDWVRRRLRHASVLSTLIYLHALQELEMETRMALVPDTWEDVRDTPLDELGDESAPVDLTVAAVGG